MATGGGVNPGVPCDTPWDLEKSGRTSAGKQERAEFQESRSNIARPTPPALNHFCDLTMRGELEMPNPAVLPAHSWACISSADTHAHVPATSEHRCDITIVELMGGLGQSIFRMKLLPAKLGW
ncbi:hypothetical protein KM043_012039 [Ampulex compressa]|nr:hypothetical protein KM043_012039 [Ampulex compressa]